MNDLSKKIAQRRGDAEKKEKALRLGVSGQDLLAAYVFCSVQSRNNLVT